MLLDRISACPDDAEPGRRPRRRKDPAASPCYDVSRRLQMSSRNDTCVLKQQRAVSGGRGRSLRAEPDEATIHQGNDGPVSSLRLDQLIDRPEWEAMHNRHGGR